MVRLTDLSSDMATFLRDFACPRFDGRPWTPATADRRVAIVSTAGLKLKHDRGFAVDGADYRVIPTDAASQVVMDHVSAGHDRVGFMQDVNVVFPLDRLRELAAAGEIGSVADFHYSFMGATDPRAMVPAARHLAGVMKAEGVSTVLLVPV